MYHVGKGEVLIVDKETNALRNPTKIHVICTRTPEGETKEFRNVLQKPEEFFSYLKGFRTFVGHNFLQYDLMEVLDTLLPGHPVHPLAVVDTLVLSRLFNYGRTGGHSLKSWGDEAGVKKEGSDIETWDVFDELMVTRCHSDTDINLFIFNKFKRFLTQEEWADAIRLEHDTAIICANMSKDGFPFDKEGADKLLADIRGLLDPIDAALATAFPPRPFAVREITPRLTKFGTFNRNDFRWVEDGDLTQFNGGPFTLIDYEVFNAGSPKQIVTRLNEAGWKPTDKTKGHSDFVKNYRRNKDPDKAEKLANYKLFGWTVSEHNLATLPATAPAAAFDLAKRISLQSRVSDVEEWLALAEKEDYGWAIHGSFSPIGAWSHRLSHQRPNLANVPVAKRSPSDTPFQVLVNDLNDRMRELWGPRPGFVQVGTDADGLQMRVFAHLVNDEELIYALVSGSKENKTDIHSLHQRKLGDVCRSRDSAKTFIYAWLLGAGIAKVAEILGCSLTEAKTAVEAFIQSYPALAEIKRERIPSDASRGFFIGLDGRKVICNSEHLMLAGYLQNGEAIIMKGACRQWQQQFREDGVEFYMHTWPHDEWQTSVLPDFVPYAQETQIQSIRDQAKRLNLNCPLEGSSSHGLNWKETH